MSSPHTFLGKVITLLIGSVLSWLTVMNAEFSATVDALVGRSSTMLASEASTTVQSQRQESGQAVAFEIPLTTSSSGSEVDGRGRIEKLATRLRQLGASYLLVERLPSPHGDQYRVRCDLAGNATRVQCCFEAIRGSAEGAMQEVIQAVLNVDSHHSDFTHSAVSSM